MHDQLQSDPALLPAYVLITPARNEEQFLAATIASVVAQSMRPLKWLIIDDGSTDATAAIVLEHAARHPWIELMRMPPRAERNFAGKALAFNAGLERLRALPFAAIACLDADVDLPTDYFAYLLARFNENPALGLIGTPYRNPGEKPYDYRFTNIEEVSGICQLFRRACVEQLGGYVLSRHGNIDTIACLSARMHGWQTRTFTGRICEHQRTMGTATSGRLRAWWREGQRDYIVGNSPLWQLFRVLYQSTHKPCLLRGLLIGGGFLGAALHRLERSVSAEMIAFRRQEQMVRLRRLLHL